MTPDEVLKMVETKTDKLKIVLLKALLGKAREYVYDHWYEHCIDNEANRRTEMLLKVIDEALSLED